MTDKESDTEGCGDGRRAADDKNDREIRTDRVTESETKETQRDQGLTGPHLDQVPPGSVRDCSTSDLRPASQDPCPEVRGRRFPREGPLEGNT